MSKLYAVWRRRERAVISGLHHYALEVPDLAVAEGFLQDFGLETGEKDGSLVATCPGRDQEQVRLVQAPWTRSGRRWSGPARPSSSRRPAPLRTACGCATPTAPSCNCSTNPRLR